VLVIYPKRVVNHYVISDRSYLDVMVSPNVNKHVARMCFDLLPKPTFFFLYNKLEVLSARRPDHPSHDIKRQLREFKKFKHYFHKQVRTESVKDTVDDVLAELLRLR
jgi:hypothetical protein